MIRVLLPALGGLTFAMLVAFAEEPAPQCPPHRPTHVTYGGLAPKPGYERDHRVPLCLGGPDDVSNVWYQPMHEALLKDRIEAAVCRLVCNEHSMSIDDAWHFFESGDWRQAIE